LVEKVLLKQMIVVFIIHEKLIEIFYFLQYTMLLWGDISFLQKLVVLFYSYFLMRSLTAHKKVKGRTSKRKAQPRAFTFSFTK